MMSKDPINVIFYGVGSAWDVNYDLLNWASPTWEDTTCNGTQRVFIWDDSHTDGSDDRRQNEYPMTPGSTCYPGTRDHIRLFQGLVEDSHSSGFGVWSVTSAHEDNYLHTSASDWEGPEARLTDAFKDSSGDPLWFVDSIWESDIGNDGTYQGEYNDGDAQFIELGS